MASEKQLFVQAYSAYRQKSRCGEAEALFRELIDCFPGTPEAARSRELLASMGRPISAGGSTLTSGMHSGDDIPDLEDDEFSDGRSDMAIGCLTFVGGVAVTIGSYLNAGNTEGWYVVVWGGILFGAFMLVRGIATFAASKQYWGFTETEFFKNLDQPTEAGRIESSVERVAKSPSKPKIPKKFGKYVLWVWLGAVAIAVLLLVANRT